MNETDAIVVLTSIGDVAGTFGAIFFSVTFAYVSVAYLVGRALTKFQCVAASMLYLLAASIFGGSFIGYSDAWLTIKARESTAIDEVLLFNFPGWLPTITTAVVGISLLSLYFMYDLRRSV